MFTNTYLLIKCGSSAFYNKMQTLCTLSERHMCSLCMQSKAAWYYLCKIVRKYWSFFSRINHRLCHIDCSFLYFLYKDITTMCSSRIWKSIQPECLNRKATNRNFLGRYIYPSGSWEAIEPICHYCRVFFFLHNVKISST